MRTAGRLFSRVVQTPLIGLNECPYSFAVNSNLLDLARAAASRIERSDQKRPSRERFLGGGSYLHCARLAELYWSAILVRYLATVK
jgi:hypothetical protein